MYLMMHYARVGSILTSYITICICRTGQRTDIRLICMKVFYSYWYQYQTKKYLIPAYRHTVKIPAYCLIRT